MKKIKHEVKTIDDIKYCEEKEEVIYSEKRGCCWKFKEDVWCQCIGNKVYFYNVSLNIAEDDLYYYEEEQEQQEATADDVGKLCLFWDIENDKKDETIGVLRLVAGSTIPYSRKGGGLFIHCRPLTKEEIKEFMEKAE